MDVGRLAAGQVIDGFRLEAPLKPGGMANLWRVTHPDVAMPLMMKVPFVQPARIRSPSTTCLKIFSSHKAAQANTWSRGDPSLQRKKGHPFGWPHIA